MPHAFLVELEKTRRLSPRFFDRLGCKAENLHSIHVYLPYLPSASDERQFRVIRDREQWVPYCDRAGRGNQADSQLRRWLPAKPARTVH
jgi:hypothetical protein